MLTEQLPISCISCRRRKIKCNKKVPCNQCVRRNCLCEFPLTFRNIKVDVDEPQPGGSFNDDFKYRHEIDILKNECQQLLQQNQLLMAENERLNTGKPAQGPQLHLNSQEHVEMSGETTEGGQKYYGPQLSNYMIASLVGKHKPKEAAMSSRSSSVSLDRDNPNLLLDYDRQEEQPTRQQRQQQMVDRSLDKKPFPSIGLQRAKKSVSENQAVAKKLVNHFFDANRYYGTFISQAKVLAFIEEYAVIKNREWEHDDDLLLLYMILALTTYRLTFQELLDYELIDESNLSKYSKIKVQLSRGLFSSFNKLRHNLINELIVLVMLYILCTEYHFMDQRYEEAWLMTFHSCLIAYLIGLHIMGRVRQELEGDKGSKRETIGSQVSPKKGFDDEDEEEQQADLGRYKLWYALRLLTGQVCSVLGRPNPISIHVNKVVQKSVLEYRTDTSERLEDSTVNIMLKTGFSECLRLSNLMLIENFMMNFNWEDLYLLLSKFMDEISNLEWALALDAVHNETETDDLTKLPKHCDYRNVMLDLIVLYVNQAKLFEPFISKFDTTPESSNITKCMVESIYKFSDYSLTFLRNAVEHIVRGSGASSLSEAVKMPNFRFGKTIRSANPFLHAFFYQGLIVIFTFLHYKVKDFVKNGDDLLYYLNNTVLERIATSAKLFIEFDKDVANKVTGSRMWSPNVLYLLNKIVSQVNLIYAHQKKLHMAPLKRMKVDSNGTGNSNGSSSANGVSDVNGVDFSESEMEMYGFSFRDPFWLTSPENIPYYLSSPSEEATPGSGHGSGVLGADNPYASGNLAPDKQYNDGQDVMSLQSLSLPPDGPLPPDYLSGGYESQYSQQPLGWNLTPDQYFQNPPPPLPSHHEYQPYAYLPRQQLNGPGMPSGGVPPEHEFHAGQPPIPPHHQIPIHPPQPGQPPMPGQPMQQPHGQPLQQTHGHPMPQPPHGHPMQQHPMHMGPGLLPPDQPPGGQVRLNERLEQHQHYPPPTGQQSPPNPPPQ